MIVIVDDRFNHGRHQKTLRHVYPVRRVSHYQRAYQLVDMHGIIIMVCLKNSPTLFIGEQNWIPDQA